MRETTLEPEAIRKAIERRESLNPRWTDGLSQSQAAHAQIYRHLELALLHYAAGSPWSEIERRFDESARWVPTFCGAYEWEPDHRSTPNRNAAVFILHGTIAGVLGTDRTLAHVVEALGRLPKFESHNCELASIAEARCLGVLTLNHDDLLERSLSSLPDRSHGMLAAGEYNAGVVRNTLLGIASGDEKRTSEGLNEILGQYMRVRNDLAHSPRWKDGRAAEEYFCLYATALAKLANSRGIVTHLNAAYEHYVPQELAER